MPLPSLMNMGIINHLIAIVNLKKKQRRGAIPAANTLYVDQIVVYDFSSPIPDTVHPLHPQHLNLRLELFGNVSRTAASNTGGSSPCAVRTKVRSFRYRCTFT